MVGVMMLVNEFAPLPTGGAEKQAERLAMYLARRGTWVGVITRRLGNLPGWESYGGLQVFRPLTIGPGKLKTISFIFGALFTLWKERSSYSILHAHLAFGPALAAVIAAHILNKKVIVKLGNSGEFGDIQVSQRTKRGKIRLAFLRRLAHVVIALDEEIENEALSVGFTRSQIRRMKNGIDVDKFTPVQEKNILKGNLYLEGRVVLLFVGRLTEQKSLDTLFKALAMALPSCPNLHLIVVGDGPLRNDLVQYAEKLDIVQNVAFAGNQASVLPYLHAADAFVLPSLSEGVSNALLEAMSARLACIATFVGGNAYILDHGRCGLLLPVGDVSAWGSALIRIGNDAEYRQVLAKAAHQFVSEHFDFRVVGFEYEMLYKEMVG